MVRSRAGLAALLVVGLGGPAVLQAQVPVTDEPWRWASFGRESGLPAVGISSITETSDGTIWVATDAGLAWFDGFVWHAMGAAEGVDERPGGQLVAGPGNRVFAIVHNQLHVGDTTGFVRVPILVDARLLDSTRASQIIEQIVAGVAPLGPDDCVVLIRHGGDPASTKALIRVRQGTASVVATPVPLDDAADLFALRSGSVYLSAAGRLYRWTPGGWEATHTVDRGGASLEALAGNADGAVVGFVTSPPGARGVLEGAEHGAVVRVAGEGAGLARAADVGPLGDAVVVYASGHVRLRRSGRWTDIGYVPRALGRSARSVLFARRGNLWFGTEDGVVLYRGSARRWTTRSFPFPDPRAVVNAIVVARDGTVWTGTEDGIVVYRLDRVEPEWIRAVAGHRLGAITGLAQDGSGAIWATSGLSFEGAYRWDGREWRHFGPAEGLAAPRVHDVVVDREGRPWFLGIAAPGDISGGPGAFRYAGGRFERWGEAEGLPSGRVYAFADDSTGALWFGTLAGISRWRGRQWTHWSMWHAALPAGRSVSVGLRPRALAVGAGRLWFADQYLGVGAIDDRDSLRLWGRRDGLLSTEAHDVHEDRDGTVWASTTRGLCAYRDDAGQWSCIGPATGLATENVWPLVVTPQGIYLGTQGEGLQVLSRAEAADPPPRVFFDRPVVRGRTVEVAWRADAWEAAIPSAALATRYRIDGRPWSPWSGERAVSLAGQRPGRHLVEVQARGLFIPLELVTVAQGVSVPLPFVLRPGFALPVGVLLALLGAVGLFAWRHRARSLADLRASEARFRSLGEAAFEGVGFLGEGDVLEVNARLAAMFGYGREEVIGMGLAQLVAPQSAGLLREVQQLMRRRNPDEPAVQLELWARRKDGSEFPAEIQTKAMPLGDRLVRVVAVRDITERHAAERARLRSEEKFAKAFWASPDAIDIARESDGRFLEVNEALVRLHGRPRDQMIGRSGAELSLWIDDAEREAYWEQMRTEGRVRGFEGRLRNAAGEVRDCLISAERIEIGGEACVIALTRDVTEQRRTVEALRMTRFAVDHAGDAILWVGADGRIGYANEAAAAVLEGWPAQLVGTSVGSVDERWDAPGWREFWGLVKRQGSTIRAGTWRTRGGETFPVEILCNHLATGGREYMVVSGRDISERVAAEQALLASEAKFSAAFRSSPNGMVIVRARDGIVLEANTELLRLLGRSRADVVGRTAMAADLWPDEDAWADFRDCVLAGACDTATDIRLQRAQDERVALLSAEPLEIAGQRCLLCVLQDVTEREHARQALEDSRRALRILSRQLMEAQEAERARISRELHDEIGQTLAAVKLNLQAIGRVSKDERVAAQVRDGIAVVDATVVEVRNLSRELRPSVLDDLGLTAALKWYLGRQAERASLTVAFTPDPAVPRMRPEVETACYRIVQEAVTNVLRHAAASRVEVHVAMDGADLLLVVRDDGKGFDPAVPARQGGADAHLGLVGMRERAENAGGTLDLESAAGAGTIVRVRFREAAFPAEPESATAEPQAR